jgi:hypothetical protein
MLSNRENLKGLPIFAVHKTIGLLGLLSKLR